MFIGNRQKRVVKSNKRGKKRKIYISRTLKFPGFGRGGGLELGKKQKARQYRETSLNRKPFESSVQASLSCSWATKDKQGTVHRLLRFSPASGAALLAQSCLDIKYKNTFHYKSSSIDFFKTTISYSFLQVCIITLLILF